MISAAEFFTAAARHGFDFYTGVPCSFLTPGGLVPSPNEKILLEMRARASSGSAASSCLARRWISTP